jgi:hypothetical protein
MPRTVEITLPDARADSLARSIGTLEEVFEMRIQRGIVVDPGGSVISVALSNKALLRLLRLLDTEGVTRDAGSSVTISEPAGVISPSWKESIENDESDVVWEEMEFTILRESNMGINGLLVMFVSGALAAVGIATGAIHLVIGAMVIAPGFEPIIRVSLGLVAGGASGWKRGLIDAARGYAALVVGAATAALVLAGTGRALLDGSEAYLPARDLVDFFLQLSVPSLFVAAVAGTAGAVLIAVNRSILTAGVMIALALVPPPAIAALAFVAGEFDLIPTAALRWGIEVVIVALTGLLVFAWKRASVHQRRAAI